MKSLLTFITLFLMLGGVSSALGNSLILTCTSNDKSYSDNIKIIGSKAIMEWLDGRFLQTGDVTTASDTYIIVGEIVHHKDGITKLGTFRYSINRTTGTFQKNLFYNNNPTPLIASGNCRKTQNKF